MKTVLIIVLTALSFAANAQQSKAITEEAPLVADEMEYGYSIKNVSTKEVSDKEFSRYEVTLYVTNKSGCSRVVLLDQNLSQLFSDARVLAKFDCINATGARLTSKSGDVGAKPMYITARVNTKDDKGKSITENQKVQVGYYLGVGETAEENVIFIVPLNAKPEIKVRVVNKASVL
jgi:hypothetical protein